MGMGRLVAEQELYECDKCESTVLAKDLNELVCRHGWFYRAGKDWKLLLCDLCKPPGK